MLGRFKGVVFAFRPVFAAPTRNFTDISSLGVALILVILMLPATGVKASDSSATQASPFRVELTVTEPNSADPILVQEFAMYMGILSEEQRLLEASQLLKIELCEAEHAYENNLVMARSRFLNVVDLENSRVRMENGKVNVKIASDSHQANIADQNVLALQINHLLENPKEGTKAKANYRSQGAYYGLRSAKYAYDNARRLLQNAEASLDQEWEEFLRAEDEYRYGRMNRVNFDRYRGLVETATLGRDLRITMVKQKYNAARSARLFFLRALMDEEAEGGPAIPYADCADKEYAKLASARGRGFEIEKPDAK